MPETMMVLPTAIAGNVSGTASVRVAVEPFPEPETGTNDVPEVNRVLVSAVTKS
jgi:hypothetical protein